MILEVEAQVLSSKRGYFDYYQWNPPVDEEFYRLSKTISDVGLFGTGPPEHQWEGKYKLKLGDVFVEAGAFWGRYGLIASKRVGKTGRVILIEPHPFNINMLRSTIKKYSLTNVTLVEGAVWSDDKIIDFCVEGNPAGSRKARKSDYVNYPNKIIKVQAYTLDSLLPKLSIDYVDLLAADVEAAEVEMVKGADRYFTEKRIRNVAIGAYHQTEFPETIMHILKSKDYKDLQYHGSMPHYGGIVYGHI